MEFGSIAVIIFFGGLVVYLILSNIDFFRFICCCEICMQNETLSVRSNTTQHSDTVSDVENNI